MVNKYGLGQFAVAKIISNADQTLNCNFGVFPNSTYVICILFCCFLLPLQSRSHSLSWNP